MIPGELRSCRLRGTATKKKKENDKSTPSPFEVVVKANGFSSKPLHFHRNISDNRKRKWFQQMDTWGIRTDLGGSWCLCLHEVGSFDNGFREQRWGDVTEEAQVQKEFAVFFILHLTTL